LQGKNRAVSPAWASLWQKVKDDRSFIPLSRLVRWASDNGIEPEDIDDAALGRYRKELKLRLVKQAEKIHQTTCRVWNSAAEQIESWPQRRLGAPRRREL
jgi:hypothetical protein